MTVSEVEAQIETFRAEMADKGEAATIAYLAERDEVIAWARLVLARGRALLTGNAGSANWPGLLVGLVGAFLVALVLSFAPAAPRPVQTVHRLSTVTPSPVVTPEAPQVPVAAPAPTSATSTPTIVVRPATGTTAAAPPTTTTTVDPASVELSCEVLTDGLDTTAGNGAPGWYRQTIPGDVAALNPDHVRGCTTVALP